MSEDLEAVLRKLRQEYIAESPLRIAELEKALVASVGGVSADLKELARFFHRLAGSGGSYGIEAVTTSARAGEHLADALALAGKPLTTAQTAELKSHISGVAAAFEAARTEDPPAHF